MKEPKGSGLLLLLAIVAVINAAPLPGRTEEKLPHSRDYYDGYVRALVDHYDEIYRSQRDLTPKGENKGNSIEGTAVAEGVNEIAAKKDEIKDANGEANEAIQANQTAESQANGQNDTTSDQPYMNPEQTGKPPVTDTKQEEAPVPDAHKLNENEKTSGASESLKDVKENMFKAEDTTNLPETMQDIKFYTGKSKEFEDMKRKRSTENEAPVIQPATAPAAKSNIAPVSQSLAAPATQVAAQPQQLATVAAQVVPQQPMSPIKAAEAQVNSDKRNQAKPDMNSESKIISHSSSTYTPGDPNKNPPVVPNNDKDPNKEEPYEKEIIPEEESGDAEASGDDEDSEGESDVEDDKKVEVNKKSEKKSKAEESMETEKKDESPEDESDNDDSDIKEDEAADKTEDDNNSDDDDADEETSSEERQSVVPMLLVPIAMDDSRDMGAMFASAGERKDNVGKKRQAKKEDKKDDKKKDDKKDDDEDEHEHAYLAPLCGYPGWYEAGHGIPYGYGTNMLHGCGHHEIGHHGYGHHGHHGYGHHTFGDHDIIGYGLGHHGGYGMGHHGYGHHGIGHHGYGHGHGGYHLLDIHGYGGHHGHGYGHHGHGLHLDNGVIMPYGGGAMFFHSPCGCHSGGLASEMSMGLPF